MKTILSSRRHHYMVRVSIFLVTVALIAGMGGSYYVGGGDTLPLSQNLEIRTWYDLDAVRDNLSGNHTLMNDLDSTTPGYEEMASPTANQGKGWQPIGFVTYSGGGCGYTGGIGMWYEFTGTFDGLGYEIRDLFIDRPDEDNTGLFGRVGDEGVIKDIGVVNATVTGDNWVGGLVGRNTGNVTNSYFTGNVTGVAEVGGLVGENFDGTVSNSYSTGNVAGGDDVGGLVGETTDTVSNSYSSSNVTGNHCVGGLVGGWSEGTVRNCYSTGNVTGDEEVGGLVGGNPNGWDIIVSYSFWDTETSGQATSAGGTGKNTTEMQDIDTFSGAGWDIFTVANSGTRNTVYVWNIVNNVTYPFLNWQPVS